MSAKVREQLHKGIGVGGAKKGRFLVTKVKMSQAIVDHCNNDLGHSFYITPLASQLMCSQHTKQNKKLLIEVKFILTLTFFSDKPHSLEAVVINAE